MRTHTARAWLPIACAAALAACGKSKSDDKAAPAGAPSAAKTADTAADPAPTAPGVPANIDPRCVAMRADVTRTIGKPVTDLGYWEPINGGSMRCIYRTAEDVGAAIEIGPATDLAKERAYFESANAKPEDSPVIANAFRASFGGLVHVIGHKGDTRIAVLAGDVPVAEALWAIAANVK
jgi:hypothetical protein